MDAELQPVDDDEYVLRRIHISAYKANLTPPILRIAFQPNKNDDTGLSLYRERFVDAFGTLANIEVAKRSNYLVARLHVVELQRLGLRVVPEPDPLGPAGHAVIPGLSWSAFQSNTARLKSVQLELARIAAAAIVILPAKSN